MTTVRKTTRAKMKLTDVEEAQYYGLYLSSRGVSVSDAMAAAILRLRNLRRGATLNRGGSLSVVVYSSSSSFRCDGCGEWITWCSRYPMSERAMAFRRGHDTLAHLVVAQPKLTLEVYPFLWKHTTINLPAFEEA